MGSVDGIDPDADHGGPDWVQGAKGVDGGAVRMVNAYTG
jgi:phosphoribosylformylglycinamidine cyclo-ligase